MSDPALSFDDVNEMLVSAVDVANEAGMTREDVLEMIGVIMDGVDMA